MFNLETIFVFLFTFSILYVVNVIFKLIKALVKPEIFDLGRTGLLFLGLSLSYIITYLTQT
jgi:hypothetical protein